MKLIRGLADLYEIMGGQRTDLVSDDDIRGRARAVGGRGGGWGGQEQGQEQDAYRNARQVSDSWAVMKGEDL